MSNAPHWNDWASGVTLVLQLIVYIPLLYIILMPWLSLALVKAGKIPFLLGFFQAMAATGWLVASGVTVVVILLMLLRAVK